MVLGRADCCFSRNYGILTRVGNNKTTDSQSLTSNTLCHEMPTTPYTKPLDYLHLCDNGPITGQYITLSGHTIAEPLQINEVYAWDAPQPEDQSVFHCKSRLMLANATKSLC